MNKTVTLTLAASVLTAALAGAVWFVLAAGDAPAQKQESKPSPLAKTAPTAPATQRPVYPHSVIPGGVYETKEVTARVAKDPVVANHYASIRVAQLKPVVLEQPKAAYVSYRKGERIYWTPRPVQLKKGETLLTDGDEQIRARCGNRVSTAAQFPVEEGEEAPTADEIEEELEHPLLATEEGRDEQPVAMLARREEPSASYAGQAQVNTSFPPFTGSVIAAPPYNPPSSIGGFNSGGGIPGSAVTSSPQPQPISVPPVTPDTPLVPVVSVPPGVTPPPAVPPSIPPTTPPSTPPGFPPSTPPSVPPTVPPGIPPSTPPGVFPPPPGFPPPEVPPVTPPLPPTPPVPPVVPVCEYNCVVTPPPPPITPICVYDCAPPPVTPVPEPETWAMLFVGLVVMGFAAKRHR